MSQSFHDPVLTIDGMTRLLLAAALIIVIVIHLASLFNMPFSIIYVLLVFGSLLGFIQIGGDNAQRF